MKAALLASVATALLVAIPAPAHAARADFRSLIAACLAFEMGGSRPSPVPTPSPVPAGVCPNCRGTGKLGDGTVSVTCPACNGTGKTTTEGHDPYTVGTEQALAKKCGLIVWIGRRPDTTLFPDAIHVEVASPWYGTAGPAYIESYYQRGQLYWKQTVLVRQQSAAPQTSSFKVRVLRGGC